MRFKELVNNFKRQFWTDKFNFSSFEQLNGIYHAREQLYSNLNELNLR
ncbi:MAG: hypothetical protein ACTS6H_00725 [Candidatus Hodgkinia cicadicola]